MMPVSYTHLDVYKRQAQNGLDKNGDLLDTINEYSVHFKQAGFDAESMFNMLINGTESGTFSVDKLGDTVKEFFIRAKDGSDSTIGAFQKDVYKRQNLKNPVNPMKKIIPLNVL